jgi:hypothetical protein
VLDHATQLSVLHDPHLGRRAALVAQGLDDAGGLASG